MDFSRIPGLSVSRLQKITDKKGFYYVGWIFATIYIISVYKIFIPHNIFSFMDSLALALISPIL